jgi:outer membrane protein TolC
MNQSARFSNARHKKHVIARAIACSLLLVLPSCQIPKLGVAEPGPGVPSGFNGISSTDNTAPLGAIVGGVGIVHATPATISAENSAQLKIEEFYNDPLLTGYLQQGLSNNRELKILEQEVQIAAYEVLSRQGSFLPFVSFGAGAGLEQMSSYTLPGAGVHDDPYQAGKFLPNALPNYQAGLNLNWQLDIWRQLRNSRDAAIQRYIAASEKRNGFVTRLVAEIAANYYGLLALDGRIQTLDAIIQLQEQSLQVSELKREQARGTALPVQRFLAEVRKNQSQKMIIYQEIIEAENRINFLMNRYPQPVERKAAGFIDLNIHALGVGLPPQLLQYRPDVRQAERELAAAGLDVKSARARFFPTLNLTGGMGYEAFNPSYFFMPGAIASNIAGNLTSPLINKKAIQAEYLSANARQLESVYNYQRVILNAYTEVINFLSLAENYRRSIEIKKQQVLALEESVEAATKLRINAFPGIDYMDVLFAQRDLMDARMVLIETKRQQLIAVVNAFQALGGGGSLFAIPPPPLRVTHAHFWQR